MDIIAKAKENLNFTPIEGSLTLVFDAMSNKAWLCDLFNEVVLEEMPELPVIHKPEVVAHPDMGTVSNVFLGYIESLMMRGDVDSLSLESRQYDYHPIECVFQTDLSGYDCFGNNSIAFIFSENKLLDLSCFYIEVC